MKKPSEVFGDIDPNQFDDLENTKEFVFDKFECLNNINNYIVANLPENEPPKIPFIHSKDLLKK